MNIGFDFSFGWDISHFYLHDIKQISDIYVSHNLPKYFVVGDFELIAEIFIAFLHFNLILPFIEVSDNNPGSNHFFDHSIPLFLFHFGDEFISFIFL
jgi:hypothetical protein